MSKKSNAIHQTRLDQAIDIINIFLLCVVLVIFIYPLLFVVSASLSDPGAVWSGKVWVWPVGFTLDGYQEIIKDTEIWTGYLNSVIYTVVGTLVNLFFTVTCAYPLSRSDFKARGILMKLYAFTMFFGGGLIPTYLLVQGLGLLDTMWAIILPSFASVTNIIITRTFFQTNIPTELREAGFLDGCTNLSFLTRIVLPLSKPILAVMALYYGVGHWNGFFQAMIYIQDRGKYPLQLFLREIVLQSSMMLEDMQTGDAELIAKQMQLVEIIKYCAIIVASLPALIIYPWMQRFFVKGVMIGSLKG